MSTPQPPQAGGYGQSGPQQQGPYAQPGPYAPQSQPGPYAQQTPPGPYAPQPQPPGPYGQGPYPPPGPGGWGGPPPPPQKKPMGLWGGLGLALAVILFGVYVMLKDERTSERDSSSDSFPAAEYKLALPKTLVGGEYKLASDMSSKAPQDDGTWDDSQLKDFTPVAAQYTGADPASGKVLVVSGAYGLIKDHDDTRRSMSDGAAESEGAKVAVPPEDIVTDGEIVRCQVLTMEEAGTTAAVPMCAWADDNTSATVGLVDQSTATQDPKSIDLKKAAATTLKVREEMRQPLN